MKYKKHSLTFLLSFFIFSSFSTEYLQAVEIKQSEQVAASISERIKQLSAGQILGITLIVSGIGFIGYKVFGSWFSKAPVSNKPKEENSDQRTNQEPVSLIHSNETGNDESMQKTPTVTVEEGIDKKSETNETTTNEADSNKNIQKQKKSVRFQDQHQKLDALIGQLDNFVQFQVNNILNKINRTNDNNTVETNVGGIEFELVDGMNENESLKEISNICKVLKNQFKETVNVQKAAASQKLEQNIQRLDELRESVSNVMLLVAENDEKLFKNVDNSFKHLSNKGINPEKAYQALGLSSANRYRYTLDDVLAQCDAFNSLYDANSDIGGAIRQVKFTLGNELSKKIYDAWLSDKEKNTGQYEHLSMLRISFDDVQTFGIDFMNLNDELTNYKTELDQLKKYIN